jgi:hypothetical protein
MKIQVCLKHEKKKEKHQRTNPRVDDKIRHYKKTRVSGFPNRNIWFYSYKMVNISKWILTLYISQVGL